MFSFSSFGAARLVRLCEFTLPVSLQVLEAGDGGGGISKRSAVSLLFPLALVFATLLGVPLPDAVKIKFEIVFKVLKVEGFFETIWRINKITI